MAAEEEIKRRKRRLQKARKAEQVSKTARIDTDKVRSEEYILPCPPKEPGRVRHSKVSTVRMEEGGYMHKVLLGICVLQTMRKCLWRHGNKRASGRDDRPGNMNVRNAEALQAEQECEVTP